jgi:ParB family transcriptional regulator, chromosome partitioning protein
MSMSRPNRFKGIAGRAFEARTAGDANESTSPRVTATGGTERLPGARLIAISRLTPDPDQPRKQFPSAKLEELAHSIRTHGVLQPLLVSPDSEGESYRVIAGERRYRAAMIAGLERLPCVVVGDLTDGARLEQQLVENLQREGISPLEECAAFEALRERCGLTHQQIAERVGKGRTYVTKSLSLRRIPDEVVSELVTAGVTSREQLVLVAQQRDDRSMRKLLRALTTDAKTVRALRDAAATEKPRTGSRRSHAKVTIRLSTGASVTVSLSRVRGTHDDLVQALEQALDEVRVRGIGF